MFIHIPIKKIKIETQKVEGYSHRDLEIILKKMGIGYEIISKPHIDDYYFRKSLIKIHREEDTFDLLNEGTNPEFSRVYSGGDVRYYYLAKHKVSNIENNMNPIDFINYLKENGMKYSHSLERKGLLLHERTVLSIK